MEEGTILTTLSGYRCTALLKFVLALLFINFFFENFECLFLGMCRLLRPMVCDFFAYLSQLSNP